MWDGEVFIQKINYIYKNICANDNDDITRLFCEKNSDKENSRKKLILYKWLKVPYKQKPDLLTASNFEKFGISDLKIEDKRVFSLESLLSESFDNFKSRTDAWLEYIEKIEDLITYDIPHRYIYYFDNHLKRLLYYTISEIEYNENSREYNITLLPPKNHKYMEPLTGSYKIHKNSIKIEATNHFQTLIFSFIQNFQYHKENILYGLSIIHLNHNLPISSKVLLTTKLISNSDKAYLYFYTNESENIKISQDYDRAEPTYLLNYYEKLESIYFFLERVKLLFRKNLATNIYLNIFFKEFKSFIYMYKKITQHKKYFVENRKRATATFLNCMIHRKSSCYIVHPLFESESNFLTNTEKAIDSVNFNIDVANKGVLIHRVFVVDSFNQLNKFMLDSINKLTTAGLEIHIVLKKDIENLVTSYDFAFPIEKDIVLHRERTRKVNNFSINPDESTIELYSNTYRLIKEKSFTMEEVLTIKKESNYESYMPKEKFLFSKNHQVLKNLLKHDGIWYFYSYPSSQNIEEKVWIIQTQFFENYTLIDAYRNKGEFFIGTHQSIVIKEGNNSKTMTAIVFDNSKLSYGTLPFAHISKSNGLQEEIFNFGFLSYKEFTETEALKILGDIKTQQLKIDYKFLNRVNGFTNI